MMAEKNGNGHSASLPPRPGADWRGKDFSEPENTLTALIELAEYSHAQVEQHAVHNQKLEALRVRYNRHVQDNAKQDSIVLQALTRIESKVDQSLALSQSTAARVHRLDNEKELPMSALNDLEKEIDQIKRSNIARDRREAVERATMNERIATLSRKTEEVEEDVEKTGRGLVGLTIAQAEKALAEAREREKEARASHAELLAEVKAEDKEIAKETREDKRWWTRQKAAWAVAIGMTVWSAVIAIVSALIMHK